MIFHAFLFSLITVEFLLRVSLRRFEAAPSGPCAVMNSSSSMRNHSSPFTDMKSGWSLRPLVLHARSRRCFGFPSGSRQVLHGCVRSIVQTLIRFTVTTPLPISSCFLSTNEDFLDKQAAAAIRCQVNLVLRRCGSDCLRLSTATQKYSLCWIVVEIMKNIHSGQFQYESD